MFNKNSPFKNIYVKQYVVFFALFIRSYSVVGVLTVKFLLFLLLRLVVWEAHDFVIIINNNDIFQVYMLCASSV